MSNALVRVRHVVRELAISLALRGVSGTLHECIRVARAMGAR